MSLGNIGDAAARAAAIVAANRIQSGKDRPMAGLRAARLAAGLSQTQAADRIGCEKVTYQQWEHGRHWPSAFYLPQIATVMRCTIEDLYLPPEDPREVWQ